MKMDGTSYKVYLTGLALIFFFVSLAFVDDNGTPLFMTVFTSPTSDSRSGSARFWEPKSPDSEDSNGIHGIKSTGGGDLLMEGGASATSGKLFSGARTRSFNPEHLLFTDDKLGDIGSQQMNKDIDEHLDELYCNHWAVVTTIFEPSEPVMKQAKVAGWCMVVVGDKKGPSAYIIDDSNGNENHGELNEGKKRALRHWQ